MKTLFMLGVGCVRVDETAGNVLAVLEDPGWSGNGSEFGRVGLYDSESDAISDLENQARRLGLAADSIWHIKCAKTHARQIPVFDGRSSGSKLIGMANTASEAEMVLRGRAPAYMAEGFGPDGEESWIPA